MNLTEIKYAHEQWELFLFGLTEEEKEEIDNYTEPARALDLFSLYAAKQYDEFDFVIAGLSPQFRFDEKLITLVLNCYQERGMSDKAFNYIVEAEAYHSASGTKGLTIDFAALKKMFTNEKFLDSIKQGFVNIWSLDAEQVPPVVPPRHNKMDDLHGFIRLEIIEAMKQMVKRIVAIESIDFENKYNDLLMAVLKLRLPIFGFEIVDQGRSGKSSEGKEAGETDFTLTSAGKDIALVEAFIWKQFNQKNITEHILKCKRYLPLTTNYYILMYYKAANKKFDAYCLKYKESVMQKINYPANWKLDKKYGFKDLTGLVGHSGEIFVAETKHGSSILTHIMINVGSN